MAARSRAVVLLLALTLAAGGCRPDAEENSAAAGRPEPAELAAGGNGGTLRYAISEPSALVPAEATTPSDFAVVGALFDSLATWGPSLEARPRAATSWSSNDEADRWTFKLRPGAKFHDGSAVTAADVEFAWELAVAEGTAAAPHLRDVSGYEALRDGDADGLAGVTALDELRLRVDLERPNARFPTVVAHPALAPIPEERWEEDPDAFQEQPVGNGPFAVSEPWARGQFVRATRFEEWRNGSGPELAEVVFQATDRETAFVAFQQERMDVTALPAGALEPARERYGESEDGYTGPGVLTGEQAALYFLGFTVDRPVVDEAEVRRAVSLAIDRSALVEDLREGNLTVARSLVPPGVPGSRDFACRSCRHDPDAAEEILGEHEVSELTLWLNEAGGHGDVAERLRRDLDAVGVDLTLRTVEDFGAYLAALRGGRAALFRLGWTLDYPTLDNAVRPLLHSSARPPGGDGFNYGGFADDEVDSLLDEARATQQEGARRSRYWQAEERILNQQQAVVPLFFTRHRLVVSERVSGFVYTPMRTVDLSTVRLSEERQSGPGAAGADS